MCVNRKNNICDNLRFSIEFSTEIILLCIRISINITISGDRNSVVAIVTRYVFDRIPMRARCFVAYRPAPRPNRPLVKLFPVLSRWQSSRSVMLTTLLVPLLGCELVGTIQPHPLSACINMFWHDLYLLILTLAVVVVLINVRAYDNNYCYYYYIGQLKRAVVRTSKFSIR